jgi:hypothetical protein
MVRLRPAVITTLLVLTASLGAQQDAGRADAQRMGQKVQALLARADAPPVPGKPVTTTFTESEINAYLRLDPNAGLPTGLRQPTLTFFDGGRVETKALVDLDMVRTAEKRGWLDPLAYVSGLMEVRMVGTFRGANGKGTYAHESASLGGVPIPKSVLAELVAFYTRAPETPKGLSIDEPFELPHRIRNVELRRGLATVTQ